MGIFPPSLKYIVYTYFLNIVDLEPFVSQFVMHSSQSLAFSPAFMLLFGQCLHFRLETYFSFMHYQCKRYSTLC